MQVTIVVYLLNRHPLTSVGSADKNGHSETVTRAMAHAHTSNFSFLPHDDSLFCEFKRSTYAHTGSFFYFRNLMRLILVARPALDFPFLGYMRRLKREP